MKLLFNFIFVFTCQFALAEIKEVASNELGLYQQKMINAYIDSSMICIQQGGILNPNYVIPSAQLFKIDSVQKIMIDQRSQDSEVSMSFTSDDSRIEYQYLALMNAELNRISKFKITTREKSFINLGTLFEPNLIEGPVQEKVIACHSLK